MRNVGWNCAFSRVVTGVPVVVLILIAVGEAKDACGAEGGVAPATRPVTVQIVSAQEPNPAAPPEVLQPAGGSLLPLAPVDDQIVQFALQRPQPVAPALTTGDQGEAWLQGAGTNRLWGTSISSWEAPALCHGPLYFEDENLERHGRSLGLLQPAASAVHFAGRAAVWPYLAGAYSPHECIYTLGRERPGSCADYRLYRPPVSLRGAVYQGAAVTGLSFVVP